MASKSGAAEEVEDDRCKELRRLPGSGNTLMVTNKVVKDEFLGGDRESCHANTVQMPVREFIGGSQPEEEEVVLSLLKELREEALQQIKKSKMSRSKVILALRQCLNSVRSYEKESKSGMNTMSLDEPKYRNRMEDGKVKAKRWCDGLNESKVEKWCDECCVYISSANFKRHRRMMHSREKSAACPVVHCGRSFYHNKYLEEHLRSVHGFDNLDCVGNVKAEDVTVDLKSNMNIEVNPGATILANLKRRIQCDLCPLYLTAGSMKQHKRAVHMGDKNFRCSETGCGKKFRFKIQLKDHMRAVHNHDKLSCPRCGARFLSYSGHRAHVTRCRDDASSAENSQTHPKRAKNCSLLDSKVIFNKEAGHNFTGSNNVFHRNLHEDECKAEEEEEPLYLDDSNEVEGVNEQQVNNTLFVSSGGEVAVQELSEEEGVDAIKKWLEENSCPSKSPNVLPGSNSGDLEVLEFSMEIF